MEEKRQVLADDPLTFESSSNQVHQGTVGKLWKNKPPNAASSDIKGGGRSEESDVDAELKQ
jgi:hypothetical protein